MVRISTPDRLWSRVEIKPFGICPDAARPPSTFMRLLKYLFLGLGFVGSAISGGAVQDLIESSSAWQLFSPHRSVDTLCQQPSDAAQRLRNAVNCALAAFSDRLHGSTRPIPGQN